jgi:hypothetical protein
VQIFSPDGDVIPKKLALLRGAAVDIHVAHKRNPHFDQPYCTVDMVAPARSLVKEPEEQD